MVREMQEFNKYAEILADIAKSLSEALDELGYEVEVRQIKVTKTNNNEKPGLTVRFKDTNVSPTIYPESYVERLETGDLSMADAVKEMANVAIQAHQNLPGFDVKGISAENAESKLYLVLINKDMNPDMVNKCAHIELNDLIAVPRWKVSDDTLGRSSFLVTHEIQTSTLKMTDDELLAIARRNTLNQEFSLKGMSEVIREMMTDVPEEFIAEMLPPVPESMYVLTNADKIDGSVALLDRNTLDRAVEKIGEPYFVILSSRHEVLLVPESTVDDPAVLQAMNKEVNATQVAKEDILGSNIMRYDPESRKLNICNTKEELREQKEPKIDVSLKHEIHHKI